MNSLDRRRVLTEWNSTAADYVNECSVVDLLEAQARRTPTATAVVHEDKRISHAELDERSNKLATHLLRHHTGRDSIVGLSVERSIDMVVGLLGILKSGAAFLPLDPHAPSQRLAYTLGDAKPRIVLTQQKTTPTTGSVPTIRLDADWPAVDAETGARPQVGISAESVAYVIYTSGSSGKPKGVMVPHAALTNQMQWMCHAFPLGGDDLVLQKTPLVFDASIWEILAPLISGATLVMARPGAHANPKYLVEAIRHYGITTVQFVPSMLRLVLEEPSFGMCKSLRRIFCGGEALTAQVRDRAFELLDAELHNLYGPTETCIQCTFYSCSRDERGSSTVPIGRPIANAHVYVLDEQRELVPIGAEGQLYVGGACLARGYLGREDLTRELFVPNPFGDPGSLLYRTGDRVRYRSNGDLEFLGRVDSQIKVGGHRIELGEIEAALMTHPGVREAAVTATDDSIGLMRIVAYVVDAEDCRSQAQDLRDHLRQILPDAMIPSNVISIPRLPRLPGGKVDRAALSVDTTSIKGTRDSAPMSHTQSVLAEIWQHALEVLDVGAEDDFFDLGGNSMKLIFVIAKANERFGTEVGVEVVSEGARLAEMAAAFDRVQVH